MARVRDHREPNRVRPRRVGGKLPIARGKYLDVTKPYRGPSQLRPSAVALAPRRAPSVAGAAATAPQVAAVADQPKGFGTQVKWTGGADLAVVAFLNSADELGLCVSGVQDGDSFEHVSVRGRPTFATSTENDGIAGLIGVVAVGAGITATAFGAPELAPLIAAAGQYAQKEFPESQVGDKKRDGYGADPHGAKARAEGGVIVCQPRAQGIYYSDDDNHKDRWIKPDGTRDDQHLPKHIPVGDAFFLRLRMPRQRLNGAGDLLLCAWDSKFPDNAGSYEVHFILRRGAPRDTTTPVE